MDLSSLNKILIIRLSSLGDVLLTTPLIRSLKNNYPDLLIDFVVREEYYDVLINNPYLQKIYSYADSQYERQNLINMFIAEEYELVIDLQNNFRSKELIRILKCPILKFHKKNLLKFLLVNFKINKLKDEPLIPQRYAGIVKNLELDHAGLDLITKNIPYNINNESKPVIGLCPGAKHFTKRWLAQNFIELGKLLEKDNYRVLLFGGKDDIHICDEIESNLINCINLSNDNDLLQTAADMKLCKAVYCNDSGLMHVATALKIPVISFFGSSVKEFGFFPYNAKSIVLQNEFLNCRPCSHIGKSKCPKKHFKCMKDITPQMAYSELHKLISV